MDLTQITLSPLQLMMVAAAVVWFSAFVGYLIGERKYRPMLGTFLGAVFSLPGWLVIALMPRKEPAYY